LCAITNRLHSINGLGPPEHPHTQPPTFAHRPRVHVGFYQYRVIRERALQCDGDHLAVTVVVAGVEEGASTIGGAYYRRLKGWRTNRMLVV